MEEELPEAAAVATVAEEPDAEPELASSTMAPAEEVALAFTRGQRVSILPPSPLAGLYGIVQGPASMIEGFLIRLDPDCFHVFTSSKMQQDAGASTSVPSAGARDFMQGQRVTVAMEEGEGLHGFTVHLNGGHVFAIVTENLQEDAGASASSDKSE